MQAIVSPHWEPAKCLAQGHDVRLGGRRLFDNLLYLLSHSGTRISCEAMTALARGVQSFSQAGPGGK